MHARSARAMVERLIAEVGVRRASPRVAWLLVVAAAAGACTMSVEIAAVRLLAPWFGTSLVVWTNVLGVILLGLALGYLLGARISRGERPLLRLGLALALGAAVTAVLPALTGVVCRTFLPPGLALHDAAELLTWGSLASATTLFLPPAIVLGMAGPLLVEEMQRRGVEHAGTAGGRVLAASTLGSLVGTFGTSHVMLPSAWVGVDRTFAVAAVVLALCSATCFLGTRARAGVATSGLLAILAWLAPGGSPPSLQEGLELLERVESRYQTVRAVEDTRFGEPLRYLQVNEGLDSFQSAWRAEPGLLGEGFYYDDFALPPWWSGATGTWRTLVLGFGAGTVHRVLAGTLPPEAELELEGVELDPAVAELGRRWFDLPEDDPDVVVHAGLDARVALRYAAGGLDQLVLDAYANQVEIPEHLATVEVFELCRSRLRPGGWLVANVGGFGFDDPVVEAVAETMAAGFDAPVLALRVPSARNFSLFVRRDAVPPRPGSEDWSLPAGSPVASLLDARELEGGWRWIEPPAEAPLTDDRSPLARLQLRSLREGRARLRDAR